MNSLRFANLSSTRLLLAVTGRDSIELLNGLITRKLPESTKKGLYTGFLNAKGRVLFDTFILQLEQTTASKFFPSSSHTTFLIESDLVYHEKLLQHLRQHRLRSQVSIESLSDWVVTNLAPIGMEKCSTYTIVKSLNLTPDFDFAPFLFQDKRTCFSGFRLYIPKWIANIIDKSISNNSMTIDIARSDQMTVEKIDIKDYALDRYLLGIPEGQAEILHESALPLESNMDLMNGIDFTKGCYLGQELTTRTWLAGVVRRRIIPITLSKSTNIPQYSSIDLLDDIKTRRAPGKLLGLAGDKGIISFNLDMLSYLEKGLARFRNYPDINIHYEVPAWWPKNKN